MTRSLRHLPAVLAVAFAIGPSRAVSGDLIRWRSVSEGEKESRSTGKPALYFFTADWCGPCHVLRDTVFSDPKAAALVRKNYIPIVVEDRSRVEGKNSEDMERLGQRFRIRGFPTLVVSRPDGKKGITVIGFPGKEISMSFLADARKQLQDLEAGERKPTGGNP